MTTDQAFRRAPHHLESSRTPQQLERLETAREEPLVQATAYVAEAATEYAGVELEAQRSHLLRVGAKVLTEVQWAVFTRWLVGMSVVDIARDLGIKHQVVSKHLHGQREAGAVTSKGGILERVRTAMLADEGYLAEVASAKAGHGDIDLREVVLHWFDGLRPNTLSRFVPLTVLLILVAAADGNGRITYTQAYEYLHPSVLASTIPALKTLGYVQSNGVEIVIVRTPVGVNRDGQVTR